jgi:hypothetical protein
MSMKRARAMVSHHLSSPPTRSPSHITTSPQRSSKILTSAAVAKSKAAARPFHRTIGDSPPNDITRYNVDKYGPPWPIHLSILLAETAMNVSCQRGCILTYTTYFSEMKLKFNTELELECTRDLFYRLALVTFDRELEILGFFLDLWLK